MSHDRPTAPSAADVGGTLLAALRRDGHFARWSIEGADPVLRAAVSEAAANHHVQALVDYAWRDSVGAAAANKESRLNTAITETVAQHLRVVAELAALTKVLDSISYPWVTVKGPALAELAYPDPALRPYVDLDVLVHPAGFGAAVAALEAYGAELFDQNWTLQRHRRRAESTFALPYGTWLDLHWHLVNDGNARDAFDWDMRTSLESRREITIGGTQVPTLDSVDTVLHVALHAALSGGHQLLWAKDLEGLTRRGDIDWGELVHRARTRRLTMPVGLMLRRSHRLLGAAIPRATLRALDVPRFGTSVLAVVERLATPVSIGRGRRTGRLWVATARADNRSTGIALAHELRRKFERTSSSGLDRAPNPLHRVDPDTGARERYFQFLDEVG